MAQRKLDNIDRDMIAAQALGYGVRYGAYKVDHPNTRDAEPEVLPEGTGKCLYCGAVFSRRNGRRRRLYCGDECRTKYCNRRSHQQRASRAEF